MNSSLIPCQPDADGCKDCTEGLKNKSKYKIYNPTESFKQKKAGKLCDCIMCAGDTYWAVEVTEAKLTERKLHEKREQVRNCLSNLKAVISSSRCYGVIAHGGLDIPAAKSRAIHSGDGVILMSIRDFREYGPAGRGK